MPEFVQESGNTLGAWREKGADADEAVDRVGEESENRADAGADPEVRNAVDAVAGRQIGVGEEARLAEGQQILPQLRICQVEHGVFVDVRFGDVLVVHSYAVERSKADVEHHRDVVGERRLEDVDSGLLVLDEAGLLRLVERPISGEVIVDRDLHAAAVPCSSTFAMRRTRPEPDSESHKESRIWSCGLNFEWKVIDLLFPDVVG
jgi:hypothetical protein